MNLNTRYLPIRFILVLLPAFLFLSFNLKAQNSARFEILIKLIGSHSNEGSEKVLVLKNSEVVDTLLIRKDRFDYACDFQSVYQFKLLSDVDRNQSFAVNTRVPADVLKRNNNFPLFEFKWEQFPDLDGVDFYQLNSPVITIAYNKVIDDFEYDYDHYKDIKSDLEQQVSEAQMSGKEKARKQEIEKQKELQYQSSLSRGDNLFAAHDLSKAREAYEQALIFKPGESYPKQKIKEIDEIRIEERNKELALKEKEKEYDELIKKADRLYKQEEYTAAKALYQDALKLKPNEKYPNYRVEDIKTIFVYKEQDKKYRDQIALADNLFRDKDFIPAIAAYETASGMKPDEDYPKRKIEEIHRLQKEAERNKKFEAKRNQAYQDYISRADSYFDSKEYTLARQDYFSASEIKPDESYPKNRIAEIDKIFADREKERVRKAADNEAYKRILAEADKLFGKKNWTEAREKYSGALRIKPQEAYPAGQISEIDKILKAEELAKMKAAELEEQYAKRIKEGDVQFEADQLELAKNSYSLALELKPGEKYPEERINEIDRILDERDRLLAQKNELEKNYTTFIQKADQYYKTEQWVFAREAYEKALNLKPNEKYPLSQIKAIDEILAQQAAELKKYQEKKARYDEYLRLADNFFNRDAYDEATNNYKLALEIFPDEAYPADQLTKIEQLKLERARKEKELKELQALYDEHISKADQLFATKEYSSSKNEYQQALILFPDKEYPAGQISKIDRILSEIARAKEEARHREEAYRVAISKADSLFNVKKYTAAIDPYKSAQGIKPDEKYPEEQLQKISVLLEQLKADKKERERIRAEYNKLIADADKRFGNQEYTSAYRIYEKAGQLIPSEEWPRKQMLEIDRLLNLMKSEKEKQQKQAEYDRLIAKADRDFENKRYDEALLSYQAALDVFPAKVYPSDQIRKIKQLLADLEKELSEKKQIDVAYKEYIEKADRLFLDEKYDLSRSQYVMALDLKPDEGYPKNKIKEIDWILEQKAKVALNPDYENRPYLEAIEKADQALEEKEWTVAEFYYKKALAIRSFEVYPRNRLQFISEMRIRIKKQEKDKKYISAIRQGDDFFEQSEYPAARFYFKKAHTLKPDEELPIVRLHDVEQALKLRKTDARNQEYKKCIEFGIQAIEDNELTIAEFYLEKAQNLKAEENQAAELLQQIEDKKLHFGKQDKVLQYQKAIKMGDDHYQTEDYAAARYFYRKALKYLPGEKYPAAQLDKIKAFYDPSFRETEQSFRLLTDKAEKALQQNDPALAKMLFEQALELKPESIYCKKQLDLLKNK